MMIHEKFKDLDCVPSEDSNKPGNPPNLIRFFAVCFMGSYMYAPKLFFKQTVKSLFRLCMPMLI